MSYMGQDAGELTPREMYGAGAGEGAESEAELAPSAPRYLIWSMRKNQWYGPNCAGYADTTTRAGSYALCDVGGIVTGALPGQLVAVEAGLAHNVLGELRGADVTAKLDSFRGY